MRGRKVTKDPDLAKMISKMRVRKVASSVIITLPRHVLTSVGIKVGDMVMVEGTGAGLITITREDNTDGEV